MPPEPVLGTTANPRCCQTGITLSTRIVYQTSGDLSTPSRDLTRILVRIEFFFGAFVELHLSYSIIKTHVAKKQLVVA